ASGLTDLIQTNAYAPAANLEDFHNVSMTPDGRFIAFIANNDNLGISTSAYLWDSQTGTNTLVSGDLNGNIPTNTFCEWPAIDPSGRFVAFLSNVGGLVTNALAGDYHLYFADILLGVT